MTLRGAAELAIAEASLALRAAAVKFAGAGEGIEQAGRDLDDAAIGFGAAHSFHRLAVHLAAAKKPASSEGGS